MRAPLSGAELQAFVAGVDAGSAAGAADFLQLTQSAVSKRIATLERRLGTRLFDRGRFGLRPTPAGLVLEPEARVALAALARAERVVREHAGSEADRLAIASSHTIAEHLLPDWLADLRIEQPALVIYVSVVNSAGVVRAVREGSAAVGLVEGVDALDNLDVALIGEESLVAVVGGSHRWRSRKRVSVAELTEEPYLTREPGSGTRAVAEAALAQVGIELPPAMESASTQSVKGALRMGGFSLLSPLAVAREVDDGSLHTLAVDGLDLSRSLRAIRLREPHRPPNAASTVWRTLTQATRFGA